MDIPSDEYQSDINRPAPFLDVLQTVKSFVRSLIGS